MATPELMATVDVAKRLRLERSTLSRWVQPDKITPAMRLPGATGAFLFDPAEVERVADSMATCACVDPNPFEQGECNGRNARRIPGECRNCGRPVTDRVAS